MKNSDGEFRRQWEILKIKSKKTSGYVIYFPLYIVVFGDKIRDSYMCIDTIRCALTGESDNPIKLSTQSV